MVADHVLDDYFDWLYFKIMSGQHNSNGSFRKLIALLHTIPFRYSVAYDENRAADGVNLRWYYVNDGGYDDILEWKSKCSVLEMLIALSINMENTIGEPGDDYSVAHWFWMMLDNLDLGDMSDNVYDKTYVYGRVSMFMDRTYEPDGYGNIFYMPGIRDDLRDVEIWYQMCWYIDSII